VVVGRVERKIAGRTLSIESGKLAKQADGAAVVTFGETIVLVTAVAETAKREVDFLPLTVEYREKQYAAGKFPGGIIKREGRPTTKEILTMRLIDRSLRSLFPRGYNDEIQVQATVLSADKETDPDVLAMIGAAAALAVSDIPFDGPVGSCRVGLVNDQFVMNPTYAQRDESELDLVISGTEAAIVMVEGAARMIPEEDLLTAMACGQDVYLEVVDMIRELAQQCAKPKRAFQPPEEIQSALELVEAGYYARLCEAHRTRQKQERSSAIKELLRQAVEEFCTPDRESAPTEALIKAAFERMVKRALREQILQENCRYDGRRPDELREIECEVAALPRTHGSALFTRGETQALVITTLGTVMDEQRVLDPLTEEPPKKFMLHYNFPPFCVGEVRPIRGPARREIGHGELAERALKPVLPSPEEFPYTIRLVSDILESNGSSSMATVCGGTLSMMDAGVPIKYPVAGVAMGLVLDGEKAITLTDIAGVEDFFGDMDFKIAGTQHGVTAIQLDLKVKGVSAEILKQALHQAREARLEILRKMLGTIQRPREHVSPHAPVLRLVKIPTDKIGTVIGPGGRTVKELQERFNVEIEIEEDGNVTISSDSGGEVDKATEYIRNLTQGVEVGKVYKGMVREIRDFGAIVELFPGVDGLCHISELDEGYVRKVEDVCKVGEEIMVKVLSTDENRTKLSRKAALHENQTSRA